MENRNNPWNSLEIVKLILLVFVIFMLFIHTDKTTLILNSEKEFHQRVIKLENQLNKNRVFDVRHSLFNSLAIPLNKIYCYLKYKRNWRELSPEEILKSRTTCQDIVYSNELLLPTEFVKEYEKFMELAFKNYDDTVKIAADIEKHIDNYRGEWRSEWNVHFVVDSSGFMLNRTYQYLEYRYEDLLGLIRKELMTK